MVPEDPSKVCPLCEREVLVVSDHHLVPKSRGGRDTEAICLDCHGMIHTLFDNKRLERELNTAPWPVSSVVLGSADPAREGKRDTFDRPHDAGLAASLRRLGFEVRVGYWGVRCELLLLRSNLPDGAALRHPIIAKCTWDERRLLRLVHRRMREEARLFRLGE